MVMSSYDSLCASCVHTTFSMRKRNKILPDIREPLQTQASIEIYCRDKATEYLDTACLVLHEPHEWKRNIDHQVPSIFAEVAKTSE